MRAAVMNIARTFLATIACAATLAHALPFGADYRVSTVAGSSQNPRIAGAAGTNNLHIAWVENFATPSTDIYYARSTNNGTSWEPAKAVTFDGAVKLAPSIAAAGNNVVIVWQTNNDTGGIYFVRSGDNGTNFTAPAPIWDAAGYSRNPEVVADGNGDFALAWYDSANNGGLPIGDIFYKTSCDGGATWTNPQDLTQHDGEVDSETPQLAVDSNNVLWMSFRSTRNGEPQGGWSPYQQYLTRRTAKNCGGASTFLWPPAPISPGLPDYLTSVYGATMVPGTGGRTHIAYWDNNAGNNIGFRTGTLANGFSVPINASQMGPNNPQITAGIADIAGPGLAQDNLNQKLHLFWFEEAVLTEGYRVGNLRYREISNLANPVPTLGAITNLTAQATTLTPKALFHNGRVHVVFTDYRNSPTTSAEIYHKFANEDGSVGTAPAVQLSETAYLFPNTAVGQTSLPHVFTLTNTGNANLTISGIVASAEFGQTNNCPPTLGIGAACQINGTFSPASAGLRNGSITISDNASGSPHTIALTGNGDAGTADTDNDGMPNSVEAIEGRSPGLKDNDIFANARWFAMQQYRDFLGREGDSAGITHWTNQINGAAQTRGQMVETFFNSAEFQSTVAPVVRLYFAYFNRIPDYPGLQFWINHFKSGNSLESVSNAFAGSPEFQATYGSLTNRQFVNLVYQNVLGRPADQAGSDFWTGQLDGAAVTRGGMMVQFSESAEYKAVSFNRVYVTMMYVGMLRRAPDQAGFDFWVGYMGSGNSGLALINGYLTSNEYRSRFLP